MATLREPVRLEQLLAVLGTPRSPVQMLEAVDGLRRRSLIERGQRPGSFTLHSVVLEYASGRLIAEASREIKQGHLVRLLEHGLCQVHAKEYVRKAQEQLLVGSLLTRLQSPSQGPADVQEWLRSLLEQLRGWPQQS